MSGEPDLSPSTSSEWVAYLQQLLNHHYQQSVVAESGEYDEATVAVVRHFREQNGLAESDGVDASVWAVLTGEPTSSEATSSQSTSTADAADPWPDAHSVKVWVKAFIPGGYAGNIDGVGAAAGHRLLRGPVSWFSDCFHTDDREFSDDIGASHRMHSEVRLELPSLDWTEYHHCGETIEHDCEDGDIESRGTADTGRMHWSNLRRSGNVVSLDLAAAANNPCFTGSPDIDYQGTLTVDLSTRTVSFQGLVNGFPAYEAYATVNDGAGSTLFRHGPSGDPESLVGDPDVPVHGSVTF